MRIFLWLDKIYYQSLTSLFYKLKNIMDAQCVIVHLFLWFNQLSQSALSNRKKITCEISEK